MKNYELALAVMDILTDIKRNMEESGCATSNVRKIDTIIGKLYNMISQKELGKGE